MRMALVLGFVAAAVLSTAQAADRKIDDFYGRWVGTGQATQGTAVTQSRDSEVVFEKAADGFKVSWTTMSSNVNEASKSKVKASEITFKRGKKPGVFVDVKSGAATEGKKTTWARLSGDTLSIVQLVMAEDGQWDVTQYDRTLKGADAMTLNFTRISNATIARQATLQMTRAKD